MADKEKLAEAQEKSAERRREKVEEFADELVDKLGDKVKCVAVYGSVSRGEHTHESDIDTFVVLDDTKLEQDVPKEAKDKIRTKVTELAKEVDGKITIQYLAFLTEFWDAVRNGEPLMISVLRNGEVVYDVGIFAPAQRMLQRGKIQSSREAVQKRLKLAASGYKKAEKEVRSSIPFKLEQAMANAGQAPVMLAGEMPPEKQDVGDALDELFVAEDMLEEKYADYAREIAEFADLGEKHPEEVDPADLGEMLEKTDDFIRRMHELVGEMGGQGQVQQVVHDYKNFLKANVAALNSRDVQPTEDKEDLPDVVAEHLDLSEEQMALFDRWEHVVQKIKDKELEDLDQEDLQELRATSREFVSAIGEDLREMQGEEMDVGMEQDVEGDIDVDYDENADDRGDGGDKE